MPSTVVIGALIGVGFALGWAVAGVQGISSRWRVVSLMIAVAISACISVTLVWRLNSAHAPSPAGAFDGAIYGWAVTLQTAVIIAAVIALRHRGLNGYVMPTVAFIVGAHFFGLARAMPAGGGRVFVWAGTLMCMGAATIIVALARSLLSSSQSMFATGIGCAIILWGSAIATLI